MKPPLLAAIGVLTLAACGGDDGVAAPVVDRIDEAIEAVELHYGAPPEFFEVSATLEEVNFIVAVDDGTAAEQGSYQSDGGFTAPEPVGPANGSTFTAEAVDFDPGRIFEQIRAELDDPVIVDFAIQGTSSGSVVYDATVASDAGGVLLVLLGPDGQILGVQAQ